MRAGLLALLDARATGTSPSRSATLGMLLEQLAEADRAREPGGPGADDQHADLDALVGRVGRLADELAARERRRVVGRRVAITSLALRGRAR